MNPVSQKAMKAWIALGPRFLPFADAATPDLPLSRLLRLSLFQVSVGMSLVLLVGTLNRVMIVELNVPASIVGIMISLPLIVCAVPRADRLQVRHPPIGAGLAARAVPLQGHAWCSSAASPSCPSRCWCCPAAVKRRVRRPGSANSPPALAFLLIGAGVHTTQTVGLALATDLASPESRPKVVGLMYTMLLFGMIASAPSSSARCWRTSRRAG